MRTLGQVSCVLAVLALTVACSDDKSSKSGGSGGGVSGGTAGAGATGGSGGATGGEGGSAGSSAGAAGTGGAAAGAAGAGTGGSGGANTQAVRINFEATVGSTAAACGNTYTLGTPATEVDLLDLRFYVSNLRLLDGSTEVPIMLDQASNFQHDSVALIDLEDGSGECSGGNAETNAVVTGTVPGGTYDGLKLNLGVPFALNHQDVSTAPPPLNIQSMFWNWLPGYKFMRIDVRPTTMVDGGVAPSWNFHLGSTMCMQDTVDGGTPNPQAPPGGPCGRPNLPELTFASFDPETNTVRIDLEALFAGSDVTQNLGGTTPGCMSFPPDQPDCSAIFPAVGLDYATGECDSDCANQTAFSVQ